MENLALYVVLGVSSIACLVYTVVSYRLDFSLDKIMDDYSKRTDSESLKQMVILSVRKVCAWNRMTMLYTILHYLLNIWSICFSCMSIYYSLLNKNDLSVFASVVALISLTCNLFLRSERKWGVFRAALCSGRKETNRFCSEIMKMADVSEGTKQYADNILEIEKSLSDSDIT